jgi:hypothetical protein
VEARVTILVQRQFRVAPEHRAEFERQSREGLWPAFLEFGARMLAYGRWEFGGDDAGVVTHTAYRDFEHWEATRATRPSSSEGGGRGAFYSDPFVAPLVEPLLARSQDRGGLVSGSSARLIDVDDEASPLDVFYRRPGTEAAALPPTFGKGSVVSERTYLLRPGSMPEFRRLSLQVWPWLEQRGGRLVAFGQDPLHTSDEVVTFFAFRSLADWHRLSRPRADLDPPADVVQAWNQRAGLIVSNQGRLLTVLTDFGTPVASAGTAPS